MLTRFLRQSSATAGLREIATARSARLGRLLACPQCLSFWIALICSLFLAGTVLEFGAIVLIGWRGAYYANRMLDRIAAAATEPEKKEMQCRVCDAPYERTFLERQGHAFCSHACWFDYLRARPKSRDQLFDKTGAFIRQEVYPMSYENVDPSQAQELLDGGEDYTYVDVRSIPEFENGHPAGAVHVPLMHREHDQMVPNMDFLRICELNFDHGARLIIGCQSGARSLRAAEALVAAGYEGIVHMDGGFGGARNEMGQIVAEGWMQQGLPVEYGAGDSQSYEALGGRKLS